MIAQTETTCTCGRPGATTWARRDTPMCVQCYIWSMATRLEPDGAERKGGVPAVTEAATRPPAHSAPAGEPDGDRNEEYAHHRQWQKRGFNRRATRCRK